MNNRRSHLRLTHKQRNGIFLLVLLIGICQVLIWKFDQQADGPFTDSAQEVIIRAKIDSIKLVFEENNQPRIFPFNPNYISDFKGYTLGMSNEEIDRSYLGIPELKSLRLRI